ncbi:borealin isoform X2 [Drosophila innubila]|uniref:borealin isoform X2 n=1 Tax=Drosophila innubila TaxID=198719 RepID=UPI00148C48AE|nr:borealin isoform X2 [Drosophila innubila]
MPRTKIPKNSKRNRDAANREEKIRIYEMKMDSAQLALDEMEMRYKGMVDTALQLIDSRLQTELRNMKMGEFLGILSELERFDDFKASDQTQLIASQSICSNTTTSGAVTVANSRNDEEDSSMGTAIGSNSASQLSSYNSSVLRSTRAMRTPGPLHSARARRDRRSRSACGTKVGHSTASSVVVTSSSSNSNSNLHRNSRSKMRTPMRPKALSADRTSRKTRPSSPGTPPLCFLRFPKPGEVALSKFGSPIVAQSMQDKFANVNIPIRNGVLSLRPKRMGEVQPDLLQNLDPDTLNQIKQLNENLQLIVDTASKAGFK